MRRELFRRGLRYRVQLATILPRRKHDIVFTRAKVVVDVRGCFWHACPQHGTLPKSNHEWWSEKLAANTRRDTDTVDQLSKAGWRTIVVWEHDDVGEAADWIERAVKGRSA